MILDMINDMRRFHILKTIFFQRNFEKYEFARLAQVRKLMDKHYSFKKENVINMGTNAEKKEEQSFVWTYVMKPIKKWMNLIKKREIRLKLLLRNKNILTAWTHMQNIHDNLLVSVHEDTKTQADSQSSLTMLLFSVCFSAAAPWFFPFLSSFTLVVKNWRKYYEFMKYSTIFF